MRAGGRGVIGGRFRLGKALVVLQVALSVLLVVGAGLMLSTLWKLASLDPGFTPGNVVLATVDLRNGNYSPERRREVFRQMLERLRAVPGAQSAALSNIAPLCGCRGTVDLVVDGYHPTSREDSAVLFNKVSDGYFAALGTPVVAGRDFSTHDTPGSPQVAVVNQSMARKYIGNENPIGHYFRIQEGNDIGRPWEIVGVVRDAKYGNLRNRLEPVLYLSRDQDEGSGWLVYFEVRAAHASIGAIKDAISDVDRGASLYLSTLDGEIAKSLLRERLLAALSGLFGGSALLLAAIGLYGVMSHNVARRRNEIGIRMALGAERSSVLRMILREIALLIACGLALGLGAATMTTRFVAVFLYDLRPNDPLTLALAAGVLASVGVLAGYWPARRASRLDPMTALRDE